MSSAKFHFRRVRRFAAYLGQFIFLTHLTLFTLSAAAGVKVLQAPPASGDKSCYQTNRAPLQISPLLKLPIGAITPKRWLRHQLELEADGLTGHLQEISKWCKFESNAWSNTQGEGQNGWEELPYWLKGYGDLGYVLKDEKIIENARKWIDAVLASQDETGWFGPRSLKTNLKGKPDLWPHMVMCNVLQSYYEYSGDERVITCLTKYFKWVSALPAEAFGEGYWPKVRAGDNLETIYWLYNRTGEEGLLDLAKPIHEHMQDWTSGVHDWHNVNIAQGFREPGVYYLQAKQEKFLRAPDRNYRTVMDLYGQFPGGGFAGDENCRPGFTDPRQGFETCGIVEFMHSFEMLTKISGDPVWADRCEEIAFNSLPAAMTPDLKALHYLTCANQVQLDKGNKSPEIQNGGTMFSYSPFGRYRCCQHNVSDGWPYFAEELWLGTLDGGLCASLYSASEVEAKVAGGGTVKISEETDYPFGDSVRLTVDCDASAKFPLYLRIPRWCTNASVKINGDSVYARARPLAYLALDREWHNGDTVTLQLPMHLSVRRWEKNHNAASVEYGPLTFSLKIGEKWSQYGGKDCLTESEVFPATPWNYGLVFDADDPAASMKVLPKVWPPPEQPFRPETVPLEIRAKAKKIRTWKQDSLGLVGKLQQSPVRSEEPVETVTLIPMGAARLRITAFPVIGRGKDAHEWKNDQRVAGH